MFLSFAAHSRFKVYQMDVKRELLNGELEKEVYVEYPLVFKVPNIVDTVFFFQRSLWTQESTKSMVWHSLNSYLKIVLLQVL